MDKVTRLASENGLVLFSKSSCCLCYAVKILFQEIGVTPTVHELDQDPEGREMERALMRLGCSAPVPAVFIGGKLVGSTNEVMSLHLSGGLIPLLRPYHSMLELEILLKAHSTPDHAIQQIAIMKVGKSGNLYIKSYKHRVSADSFPLPTELHECGIEYVLDMNIPPLYMERSILNGVKVESAKVEKGLE
ncbi:hypothetical protein Goshw_005404 [Gossypium schwendimanii]|uniref:Glutaredoxin domain-containing protein n=1 Tax=Gossypium schwendimanii TaxID=34291 RepID=A0A7J9N7J5_GOSSC|nr:hypothetical protein [Gossypium schwendimanii]